LKTVSWSESLGVREATARQTAGVERLLPEDDADAVAYVVTRDRLLA
jgi:hypothetical protein